MKTLSDLAAFVIGILFICGCGLLGMAMVPNWMDGLPTNAQISSNIDLAVMELPVIVVLVLAAVFVVVPTLRVLRIKKYSEEQQSSVYYQAQVDKQEETESIRQAFRILFFLVILALIILACIWFEL